VRDLQAGVDAQQARLAVLEGTLSSARTRLSSLERTIATQTARLTRLRGQYDIALFRETGCDAVMCGRATMKNPWIFRQAADLLAGRPVRPAALEDRRAVILEHFGLIVKNDGDLPKAVMGKLRTFTGWYTHGLPDGTELRRQIQGLDSPQAFLDAVHAFFDRRAARAARFL
jgi:hypothetical protein